MIPNIVKGASTHGLLYYLAGEGRENEHTNPRVIGGDPFLQAAYGADELGRQSAGQIATYLDQPRVRFGAEMRTRVYAHSPSGERVEEGWKDQHVWHCSLSLPPGEVLSEDRWEAVSREFMDGMGFTAESGKAPARWVAIHHGASAGGNDHVHLAASMIREDGTRWEGRFRDWPTSQRVCRELEVRHGLVQVAGPEMGTATRGTRPVEARRHQQEVLAAQRAGTTPPMLPAREEMALRVRAAAVASTSEAEWVRRVRSSGLVIKPRFAEGSTDVVVGYRAALKSQTGGLNFYGGGQLGRDLSLPRLREAWPEPSLEQAGEASAEWQAAHAGRPPAAGQSAGTDPRLVLQGVQRYADRVTGPLAGGHRGLASAVAHDVAGTLAAWSAYDPARAAELTAAAAVLSRTAQDRRPGAAPGARRATTGGAAAIFMAAAADKRTISAAALMAQLIRTAEAVAASHRATANHREAERVSRGVVARLQALQWSGYGQPAPTTDRVRTAARTAHQTYSNSPTTREDDRDAGR